MLAKKKLIILAISTASAASFAAGFDGWQVTAGIDNTNAKLTGGEYSNLSSGVDQGYGASDGASSKTGVKMGIGYGMSSGSFITTLGADYTTGSNAISNSAITPTSGIGPNGINVGRRIDLYVAPGYKINPDTVAYAKVGYTNVSTNGLNDTSTGAAIGNGPGSSGVIYGVGFKQRFDHNSPYFYAVDYTVGSTNSGQITDPTGAAGYDSKLKFSSLSLSLGYSF
jgi:hypothetical protein